MSEFQRVRKIARSSVLDAQTQTLLGEPPDALIPQTLTSNDFVMISPTPTEWKKKAQVSYLGYNSVLEMAAEKFHTTPAFLQRLNSNVNWTALKPGCTILAPNLDLREKPVQAAKILISLSKETIQTIDAQNRLTAHFPCSVAKEINKRPVGLLKITHVIPNPNYTFNPKLLSEAAKKENITTKFILPPGPNNPVGLGWIGLSLPGYGIHGTPIPEEISTTESHGCFRLANWNIINLIRMVKIDTPVEVIP